MISRYRNLSTDFDEFNQEPAFGANERNHQRNEGISEKWTKNLYKKRRC